MQAEQSRSRMDAGAERQPLPPRQHANRECVGALEPTRPARHRPAAKPPGPIARSGNHPLSQQNSLAERTHAPRRLPSVSQSTRTGRRCRPTSRARRPERGDLFHDRGVWIPPDTMPGWAGQISGEHRSPTDWKSSAPPAILAGLVRILEKACGPPSERTVAGTLPSPSSIE